MREELEDLLNKLKARATLESNQLKDGQQSPVDITRRLARLGELRIIIEEVETILSH